MFTSVEVTNNKTGKTRTIYSMDLGYYEAIAKAIETVADSTPAGELPDNWTIKAEIIAE